MFAPSLTLVVPAYNERDNLPGFVAELIAFGRANLNTFEILVVDDGSKDGCVEAIAPEPELRVVKHEVNRGLTQALRTGFFAAQHELVTWAPADGQIPASEIAKILGAWDGHDLVLSTYRQRPDGLVRIVMSRTLRVMLRLTTGLRDRLEGTYLFRRALLDQMEIVARAAAGSIGFEIAAKARALGKRITTTEIECAPRRSGQSKVANWRNVAQTFAEMWRIGRSMRHLRR